MTNSDIKQFGGLHRTMNDNIELIETDDGPRFVINGEEKTPEELTEAFREVQTAMLDYLTVAMTEMNEAMQPLVDAMSEGRNN